MSSQPVFPLEGGCACGQVRYRVETAPLFVHCCHCRWCQRETGSAFVINALIEADRVTHLTKEPQLILNPSESGKGQTIARCPKCQVAIWSNYSSAGPILRFVRVGTLDQPDVLPPDIHIYISTKQPWVILNSNTRQTEEYYEIEKNWPPESLERRKLYLPKVQAYQAEKAASSS